MNNKARQIALHITGCVLFLSLPFLFSPDRQQGFLSVIQNPGYYSDLFRYILLILFFYLNYYYLIPRVYFSKKYFIYFALIVACFFIIYSLPHLLPILGWYQGRATHVHVYNSSGASLKVTQIAFPEGSGSALLAENGYNKGMTD